MLLVFRYYSGVLPEPFAAEVITAANGRKVRRRPFTRRLVFFRTLYFVTITENSPMKLARLMLLSLVLVLGVATAGSDEAQARLQQALKSLDSLQAEFRQTVLDEDKQVVSQSSGTVAIQRPGRFRWAYTEPYEQQIIADGKELWVYDVDLDQATVKPIESSLSSAPIMVLMKKQRVTDEFEVKPLGQRKYLYWLELIPKQKDMEYSRIYLGLDGDEIRAMELRDSFGQSTQIVFENPRYNVIFPPDTFRFDPPPGVDVFGAGG